MTAVVITSLVFQGLHALFCASSLWNHHTMQHDSPSLPSLTLSEITREKKQTPLEQSVLSSSKLQLLT